MLKACVLILLLSAQIYGQSRVVRVSADNAVNPAEVSVAINPANPDQIVAASFQFFTPFLVSNVTYTSTDAGKTWKTTQSANPKKLTQGDDALAYASEGRIYHSYICFQGIRQARPKQAENGIYVTSSTDAGITWSEPVTVINHQNSVTPFEDKPYLRVDNAPKSKYRQNLYIAWTRFDEYGSKAADCRSHIYFSRSDDGGKTFSMPIRISDEPGDCVDSDHTVEGAVPAVGPDGEIYVVWSGPKGLVLDKSTDGGLSFGKDTLIAEHPGGWDVDVEGISRSNGMPVTGVDLSSSPFRGTLYVNWIDDRNGDLDVFVASSQDGGKTFSKPVRVNDDALGNGKAQFFTWMSVDPVDGAVNLIFYDRRDLEGTKTGLTLARSIDGGKTFVNHRVDLPEFSCNKQVFFGDYIGIDSYNGRVVAVFNHFLNERQMAVSAAIYDFRPGTQQSR